MNVVVETPSWFAAAGTVFAQGVAVFFLNLKKGIGRESPANVRQTYADDCANLVPVVSGSLGVGGAAHPLRGSLNPSLGAVRMKSFFDLVGAGGLDLRGRDYRKHQRRDARRGSGKGKPGSHELLHSGVTHEAGPLMKKESIYE